MAEPNNSSAQNQQPAEPAQQQGQNQQPAPFDAAQFAESLVAALDKRTSRAEGAVVKSFAEQYGMSEEDVTSILTKEKNKRAALLPPEVQAQIDAANKMVIRADVQTLGAEMGLLDADAAMQLMDTKGIKLEDGKVTGTQAALDALKKAKPYLFGEAKKPAAYNPPAGGTPQPEVKNLASAIAEHYKKGGN